MLPSADDIASDRRLDLPAPALDRASPASILRKIRRHLAPETIPFGSSHSNVGLAMLFDVVSSAFWRGLRPRRHRTVQNLAAAWVIRQESARTIEVVGN